MRGIAAVFAASAAWVLVTGRIPEISVPRLRLPGPRDLAVAAAAGLATVVVTGGLLGVPAAAAALGVIASGVPIAVSADRRRRERERIAAAWPDLLVRLRARISAGSPLPEAFVDAAQRAPEPLRSAVDEALDVGAFPAVCARLRDRLDDPTADRVLVTLSTAHQTGGSRVGDLVAALGASVADELRLRAAHDAALTEQRLTATVALVAPWGLLALTIATNPQAAAAFSTPSGGALVTGGLLATGLGYLAARRAARLAQAPRVFR